MGETVKPPIMWFLGDSRFNAGDVYAWAGDGEGTAKIRPVALGEGGPVHQVARVRLERKPDQG